MKVNLKKYNKGDIIRFIRQWTGLTQQEFALKTGKSKRTIEQYEAGTVMYNIDYLLNIAHIFNLDIIIEKNNI